MTATPRHLAGARILAQGLAPAPDAPAAAGPEAPDVSAPDSAAAGPRTLPSPVEAARSFGAHQGQDVAGVMASLALRTGGEPAPVLAAFDRGEVVRGYPMRGTVFAVAADTLAWLTELCAAAPLRAAISRRGQLGLDEAIVDRAREILEDIAAEHSRPGQGRGVTRKELMTAWEAGGVPVDKGRGYHLLAELITMGDAVYGPWREGDTAIVLARQWLPAGSDLDGTFNGDRVAAVEELALRYVTSRGPVGERDLAWWSKLPLREIRPALDRIAGRLETGYADRTGRLHTTAADARSGSGEQLWWRPGLLQEYADAEKRTMRELLLPGFDELVLGYRDRLYLMEDHHHDVLVPGNNGVFKRAALRRGAVAGTWTRKGSPGRRKLVLEPVREISDPQRRRFEKLFAAFPYTAP